MRKIIGICLTTFSLCALAAPAPFPVFLKSGFSSILEFDEIPLRVVLGDTQSFQVEKMDRSLAIKTFVPYASTNMFVYFKVQEPKLFILTASEDAVPTYYKKFESPQKPVVLAKAVGPTYLTGGRLVSARFDSEKDYLTVDILLSADSKSILKPHWEWVRLSLATKAIPPTKLWAERKEAQKDSRIRARFIFAKPNVPRNLTGVSLIIPILGSINSIKVNLGGKAQ